MSAVFSPCGVYCYRFDRTFLESLFTRGLVAWIGLHPRTASEDINDPTLRREINFSQRWGFGAMRKLNLYAIRSTDPVALKMAPDPIGPDNDRHLVEGTAGAKLIVCAWGMHANDGVATREADVVKMLRAAGRELHCLRLTRSGNPGHTLYLPSELEPIQYEGHGYVEASVT